MNSEKLMSLIALGAVGTVIAFGLLLFFHPVPGDNKDLVNAVVIASINFASAIIGYFFGSSKGSADKNELLRKE